MKRVELDGISLMPGVAIGPATVRRLNGDREGGTSRASGHRAESESAESGNQHALWKQAQEATSSFLAGLQCKTEAEMGASSAGIFEAQKMILEDPVLGAEVAGGIDSGLSARDSVIKATDRLAAQFEALDNEYMRGRAADIRDLQSMLVRAIANMAGGENCETREHWSFGVDAAVFVAHDPKPSDIVSLDRDKVLGIVMEHGSLTSHASILARAFDKPTVIGVKGVCDALENGSIVIVDGNAGRVIVNPDPEEARRYREESASNEAEKEAQLGAVQGLIRAKTAAAKGGLFVGKLDAHGKGAVELAANVGGPDDLETIRRQNLRGVNVGICRTEFMFLDRADMPTEEEQIEEYMRIIQSLAPAEVTFRTLDVGGDKFVPALDLPCETNPFLGIRGIRLLLRNPEILRTQLRAILRAAAMAESEVSVMFPMVTVIDEWKRAMKIAASVEDELRSDRDYADSPPAVKWGIMVEVPATALTIDEFAGECDFFSIGTNDLTQYTMAADRTYADVAHLYMPTNRAVVELIRETVRGAHAHGKPVSVCGEMAALPEAVPLLIEAGVDQLSMNPVSIPNVATLVLQDL